jgi:CPA2 family monovalent cation:H+ antiporter-2
MSLVFIELGLAVVGLAFLARVASRFGFSAIPLYLIAGLAFGNGGILPLRFGQDFVHVGAEVGVVLLLFMLGLEYTGEKLLNTLRTGYPAGIGDLLLNFAPGLFAGMLLRMPPLGAVLLGGVTYISSSGVIAKILAELGRMGNSETPLVITVLVLEDLAMAAYLPVVGVLLSGHDAVNGALSVFAALLTVVVVLLVALHLGKKVSRFVAHQSDEVVLLSTLGLVLLVSGVAQRLQVSAAIGAFLVGVAISGPVAHRAERLLSPLRDLFAATFFLFFGLQIDPATLPPVLGIAFALAGVTAATKLATGWWAGRRQRLPARDCLRAGATLVPRGEFSIVIAGLGATIEPRLGPLSAAYVLILAVAGPLLARSIGPAPGAAAPARVLGS